MPDMPQSANAPDLPTIVANCLPKLKAISCVLEIYGGADDASVLGGIIHQLEGAISASPRNSPSREPVSNFCAVEARPIRESINHKRPPTDSRT